MLTESYSGRALSHVLLRAREDLAVSWSSEHLQMMLNFKVLLSLLIALELSLLISSIDKVKMVEELSRKRDMYDNPSQKVCSSLTLFKSKRNSFFLEFIPRQ